MADDVGAGRRRRRGRAPFKAGTVYVEFVATRTAHPPCAPLTAEQRIVLDDLTQAFGAVAMHRAELTRDRPCYAEADLLRHDLAIYDRAVRAADKAGLLQHADCADHPAVAAARQRLPVLHHDRAKVRKIRPISERNRLDRLWMQFHGWLASEVRRLRSQGLTYEAVQAAVVRGLHRLPNEGAGELATYIGRLEKSAWHERARSLLPP